ncbi:MAG: hypothetical protein HOJ69_09940 [Candidatus Marinimicrobia bacterium]|jgi:hypothetical protein|nr:hypothetical protein [Candidatus Neomarinimicrobiota bacterium]
MKKILLILSLVFWIGCASVINHPITGEKIPVPPKFVNKIDFDLTIQYKIDKQNQNSSGKVASALEESAIALDITSLEPLLATSDSELTLGNLTLTGVFPTYVTLGFKELEIGVITITIKPTFGGYPVGTINKWILIESKELLIERMNKIMNPIGYKYLVEEPLK